MYLNCQGKFLTLFNLFEKRRHYSRALIEMQIAKVHGTATELEIYKRAHMMRQAVQFTKQ